MAAITVTSVTINSVGASSRNASTKQTVFNELGLGQVVSIPLRVSSGTGGTSSTDTFTLSLTPNTTSIVVSMRSTTGTVGASSIVLQSTDTVGVKLPAVAAGGAFTTQNIPVKAGETVVLTTGTLATAGTNITIHEFGSVLSTIMPSILQ